MNFRKLKLLILFTMLVSIVLSAPTPESGVNRDNQTDGNETDLDDDYDEDEDDDEELILSNLSSDKLEEYQWIQNKVRELYQWNDKVIPSQIQLYRRATPISQMLFQIVRPMMDMVNIMEENLDLETLKHYLVLLQRYMILDHNIEIHTGSKSGLEPYHEMFLVANLEDPAPESGYYHYLIANFMSPKPV